MSEEQKNQIRELRNRGLGYKRIAKELNILANSVKSYCRRNRLCDGVKDRTACCEQCGKVLHNTPGKKKKRFFSDKCRQVWCNSHLDVVKRKANYLYHCLVCGKEFTAYGNANRKYCSHKYYVTDRFKDSR